MARRFIRPRLSDQQGNVLSGGWLRVLAAGTDTEVDVFAAAVGGTALAQPLSTDARGEVECWLIDSVDVDLEWSDSGATYRGGTSRRAAFSTFTEFVEAPPAGGGAGSGLHADLTDTATEGHPASAITGLGDAALLDVGTTAGTVAAGDDGRFLPPDPGAPLANLAGFVVTLPGPNAVYATWTPHPAPTMGGGLGHYVIEVAVDAGFTTVIGGGTVSGVGYVGNVPGGLVPPLYFRAKAVDHYGNESAWAVAGENPVTVEALGDAAALDVGTTTGTVAAGDDARILGALSAVTAASTYQPLDSDLTAIAALSTTAFGRALLVAANAADLRTAASLGDASTRNVGSSAGTVAAGDDPRLSGGVTTAKVLGQSAPGAATPTDLYTVPALTNTLITSLVVCNRSATTAALFRVAVRPNGAVLADQHYLYYDVEIPPADTFIATTAFAIDAADIVTVRASTATLSFGLYGEETA